MQNHPGIFRAFFATLAAAAFLALTLSSCAVTVALPNGSASSPSLPSKPELPASTERPSTSNSASSSEASSSSTSSSSESQSSSTTSSSSSEVSSSSSSESVAPAPSPAKWSENGTTLIGYVFPEDFNGTLILPTDRSYTIATNAFSGNKAKIKKLVVPSNVVEIKMFAFKECPYLTEVVFEGSSTILGKAVFQNCNNLCSVTLPQQLKNIPEYLFSGCTQLKTVNMPAGVQTIEAHAFEQCEGLSSIVFPESLIKIRDFAFQMAGLTEIILPKSITTIGMNAFYQNQKLQYIAFSDGTAAVELGQSAFSYCANLDTVILRGNIISLPMGLFEFSKINTLYIPATVINISITAIDYDTPPKTICFAGSESEWNAISEGLYWSEDATVIVKHETIPPSSDTLSLLSSLFSIFL